MPIVTDLNHRERARYASSLERMAEAARLLAQVLRDGDDTAAAVQLVVVSLSGATFQELSEVFQSALTADVPDYPPATGAGRAG